MSDSKDDVWANRIIYSSPVRMGNWIDNMSLQNDENIIHNYKKQHGQLLVQKIDMLYKNLLKPQKLNDPKPILYYGANYQLKNYNGLRHMALLLAAVLNEQEIVKIQNLIDGCAVTASPLMDPTLRNTIILIRCDLGRTGQVHYGEDIYIAFNGEGTELYYLECKNATINNFAEHLSVRLCVHPSPYCRFKILNRNRQKLTETHGLPIPFNQFILIQHSASGRNLAVEYNNWIPTFFGEECLISCHTYKNSNGNETCENFWKFVDSNLN